MATATMALPGKAEQKKTFPRYELMFGKHVQRDPHRVCRLCNRKGVNIKVADCDGEGAVDGQHDVRQYFAARFDGQGGFFPSEPFESDGDLAKRWPEKFREIREAYVPQADLAAISAAAIRSSYDKMGVKALKAIAEAEEIPLGGAKTKDEIINALMAHYEAMQSPVPGSGQAVMDPDSGGLAGEE
jgi:hypothetical protein